MNKEKTLVNKFRTKLFFLLHKIKTNSILHFDMRNVPHEPRTGN